MTATRDLAKHACETYYFHAAIGMDVVEDSFCSSLQDTEHPDVWDRNRIFDITARTGAEIDKTMAFASAKTNLVGYSYISTTPFTSPAVIARLLLDDYQEQTPVIQMVLQGELAASRPPGFRIQPVSTDRDWRLLYELVRADHSEGARTQGHILDAQVTRGIVDGYRGKAGPCQFVLAFLDEELCAYGSATTAPNGIGMVEDLFTLPSFRRQGVATALISACVEHLRQNACEDILIGSLATEPPKALYRKIGFQPVCVTRSFLKQDPKDASN
ncbi:GNAT family N-acetyltransferase [Hyphomonas adhaerens]|uniref:GNAT family N-acetyltransferase n=1 Tax=Hyphomonas adhaerens TaxID=81029 RepID=UPI002355A790|nr:GNAT family N-acetyltransferase [Hyphomonas adhaerens]